MTHVGCPLLLFPATCTLRQALQSSYMWRSNLLSHFVHRVGTSHIPRFSSFALLRLTSNQAKYQIVTKTHHAYHHNISQVLNLTLLIFVWHCLRSHCISLSLSSSRNSPQLLCRVHWCFEFICLDYIPITIQYINRHTSIHTRPAIRNGFPLAPSITNSSTSSHLYRVGFLHLWSIADQLPISTIHTMYGLYGAAMPRFNNCTERHNLADSRPHC